MRALDDAGGREHGKRAGCRIVYPQRVAARGTALGRGRGSGRDDALARIEGRHGIVDRTADQRIQLVELLEVVPTIFFLHRHGPHADHATEIWTAERNPAFPFRVGEVGPVFWCLVWRYLRR